MKITFDIDDADIGGLREAIRKGIVYQNNAKKFDLFTETQKCNIRILRALRKGLNKSVRYIYPSEVVKR
jgi:hypothetical protein